MSTKSSQSTRRRRGFTLLEVILATALTATLMGILSMLISVTLRATNRERSDVEQAHLGSILLRRISSDLRNAVQFEPPPLESTTSSLGAATSGAAGAFTSGAGAGTVGAATGAGGATGGSTTGGATSGTGGDEGSTAPQSELGVFGTTEWVEIDSSRIPNTRELDESMVTGVPVPDVRTIGYYLGTPQIDPSTSVANRTGETGLFRRTSNPINWAYARENALGAVSSDRIESLAPEVVGLEFHYFDGTNWVDEWDSIVQKCLPAAIEITLLLNPDPETKPYTGLIPLDEGDIDAAYSVHRLTVNFPAARLSTTESEEGAAASGSTTKASSQGSAGNGSSAGGSAPRGGGGTGRGGGFGAGGGGGGGMGGGGGPGGGGTGGGGTGGGGTGGGGGRQGAGGAPSGGETGGGPSTNPDEAK